MRSKRRPKKDHNSPVFCRLPDRWIVLIDAAAEKFSLDGIPRKVSRSDVIRKFVGDGLAQLGVEA